MKNFMFLLSVLAVCLFAMEVAGADDDSSVLDRIAKETKRITDSADAHAVTLVAGNTSARGVLVGDRPWVVVALTGNPTTQEAEVRFEDGTKAKATRRMSDAELGLAVYELADDSGEARRGLDVRREWTIERGELVVAGGGTLGMALIDGVDRLAGRVRAGNTPPGALLLGTRGELIGVGGVSAVNCAQCHVGALAANPFVHMVTSRGQFRVALQDGTAKVETPTWSVSNGSHLRAVHAFGSQAVSDPHQVQAHPGHYVAGPVIARVLDDLEKHGHVRYAYLGVVGSGGLASVSGKPGVRLAAVLEESPAAAAGLKKGQILHAIDGHPCRDAGSIGRLLLHRLPGSTVVLDVHGGAPVKVVLGDRNEARKNQLTPTQLGLNCVPLDSSLRAYMGVGPDVEGVVVARVVHGTRAQTAGAKMGDIIVSGGGGPIRDIGELEAVIASADKAVVLGIQRDGNDLLLRLTLPVGGERSAR